MNCLIKAAPVAETGQHIGRRHKRKAIDEHYAFHYPERYAIENLRKELASAKEQISDLEEQGQTGEALQSLKSRAAMLEDEINELAALIT